jgi:hypothetical protein
MVAVTGNCPLFVSSILLRVGRYFLKANERDAVMGGCISGREIGRGFAIAKTVDFGFVEKICETPSAYKYRHTEGYRCPTQDDRRWRIGRRPLRTTAA